MENCKVELCGKLADLIIWDLEDKVRPLLKEGWTLSEATQITLEGDHYKVTQEMHRETKCVVDFPEEYAVAIAEADTLDLVNKLMEEDVKSYLEASWKKLGDGITIKGRKGEYISIQTFTATWGTCVPVSEN